NEYSKAEESYIHARDISSQIGHQPGVAQALQGMGQVHSAREEYTMAAQSYLEAEQIYQRIGDIRSFVDIIWCKAWLHRHEAQYDVAERFARQASTIYGGLGLEQNKEKCDEFLEEIRSLIT
ncbi:hypothetical protein FRC01_011194, partial [Tulasnella sp. 417]